MSTIQTGRPPYQKGRTPTKKPRKGLRRVSPKRAAYRASDEGQDDLAYLRAAKSLPCCVCRAPAPSEAHHCRDLPPADEPHGYMRLPAAGRKSHDRDTIPLCRSCHLDGPNAYHRNKAAWRERNGPDFGFIPVTRAAVAQMNAEIEF